MHIYTSSRNGWWITWQKTSKSFPKVYRKLTQLCKISLWKTLWIEQCFNFRAISSIKGELIPYLVNKQFQEHKNVDREVTGTAEKKCLNQESGNNKIGKHPLGELFLFLILGDPGAVRRVNKSYSKLSPQTFYRPD